MFPVQDSIPTRNPPVMIIVLITLNSLAFALETILPPDILQAFIHQFGIVPARYTHYAWAGAVPLSVIDFLPFLTTMFLHGGLLHIMGNMWFLWIFGDNVEDRMGPFRFLLFYLFCGLVASVVHVVVNPTSTTPTIGASGAVAGVMGAYLMMYPHARVITLVPVLFYPLFFDLPAPFYLGYWAVLNLFSGLFAFSTPLAVGGIAFWAHVGGFAAGAMTFTLFLPPKKQRLTVYPDRFGATAAWNRIIEGENSWRR